MDRKTPDELLTEAEQEVKSGKLMRQRSIKKYLIGFRRHLQEDRVNAELTVKSHLTGVKSFYQTFLILRFLLFPGQGPKRDH
jgi:hypothetical protein